MSNKIKNNQANKDLRELKKEREVFKGETFGESDLRKTLGLTKTEIIKIRPIKRFGLTRFTRGSVSQYLYDNKEKINRKLNF